MQEAYYPSVEELVGRQRTRSMVLMLSLVFACAVIFGAAGAMLRFTDATVGSALALGFAVLIVLGTPVLIWFRPRAGLYILLASTVLEATAPWMGKAYLSGVPIWYNTGIIGDMYGTRALDPLIFSPGEIVFMLTAVSWAVQAIAAREFHPIIGEFFWWIVAYLAMVAVGYVYGVSTGGDKVAALREVRAQFHFLGAYLLAANMLRDVRQLKVIVWITAIGIGLVGVVGTITYLTMAGPVTVDGLPGLTHPASLRFNILFFIAFISIMTRIDRRLAIGSSLLAIPAVLADLANQRRAGIASFVIAFVPLLPLLWTVYPKQRKRIITFAVVFACVSAVYLPLAWNGNGPWALPARAIRSNTDPNDRDAASNAYRYIEDTDLKYTRDTRPWLGIGYGKRFFQVIPLPAVSTDLLYITPHNSVLWVWMRLGHVGFLLFLLMFAAILIRGPQIVREAQDPYVRMVGILAVLAMLMIFVYGKYDLQLVAPDQMNFSGILVGILGALRYIDARTREAGLTQPEVGDEPAPILPPRPQPAQVA